MQIEGRAWCGATALSRAGLRGLLFVLASCAFLAGAQAQDVGARDRALAEAGLISRSALEASAQGFADAQDDAVLQRTLFGEAGIQDLTEEQANDMLAAASRRVERRRAKLEEARKLVDAGAAARLYLTPFLEELDRSRRIADLAEVRAKLIRELAEMVRMEEPALTDPENMLPEMRALTERFGGSGTFRSSDIYRIEADFAKQFGKALPVSARGQTALHRSLGFDHRGRVDVALDPDHAEGRWLRGLLQNLKIPYFAFRIPVRGKSTGPHIHIGPPSESIRSGG